MKVAWCITGAEMFLNDVIGLILEIGPERAEVFTSKAAEELLLRYKLMEKFAHFKVHPDEQTSYFQVRRLFSGKFDIVVIAPCSTNTIAKMVHGISDNLVTNIFSQAGKIRLPIYILPSDTAEVMQFSTKSGKTHILYLREIDKENLRKLKNFEGVKVLDSFKSFRNAVIEAIQ